MEQKPKTTSTLSAQPTRGESLPNWVRKVIEQRGYSVARVATIYQGILQPMRNWDSLTLRGRLILELPLIAQEYGARFDLPENVLKECIRLILRKFKHLGLEEIREAYREWAVGELAIKGGELYGGIFNAGQLAKVLSAYSKHRQHIATTLTKKQDAIQRAQKEKEATAQNRAAFAEKFPKILAEAKIKVKHWRDIPLYWYAAAQELNLLKIDNDEAWEIFREAQCLAKEEIFRQKQEAKTMKDWLYQGDPQDIAKGIARKLCVWRKLIKNERL